MPADIQVNFKAQKLFSGIKDLKKEFPETAFNIAIEFGEEAKKEGVAGIIPRKFHNLASTARVKKNKTKLSVVFITGGIMGKGSPPVFVDYAKFVNDGTSRQAPQFFMERSVNRASMRFDSISRKALASWLKAFKR